MIFIVSSFVGTPYQKLSWGPTMLVVGLSLLAFYLLTWAWEKIGYIGSLEWMLATIASYLIPGKKTKSEQKWWERGRLNVEGAFYNAEWIDVVTQDEAYYEGQSESRLSYKLGILGFIFFPFSFVSYVLSKNVKNHAKENDLQKKGQKLGLIGMIFFATWLILFISLKLSTLGISF
jgi:hypothetical protein